MADARGTEAAAERLRVAVGSYGPASVTVARAGCVLGAWKTCDDVAGDDARAFVLEGNGDLADREISAEAIRAAAGDFAVVAAHAGGLLLGSGPAGGHRPIYTARVDADCVAASTHVSALVSLLQHVAVDVDGLATMLATATGRIASLATPYAGVQRVAIHEAWWVRPGRGAERVSTFRRLADDEVRGDAREWVEILRDAVRGAIGRSVRRKRAAAVMVSGGVDSGSVLATAFDMRRRGEIEASVGAFWWQYATHHGDDGPYLRSLAEHLGVKPQPVTPREASSGMCAALVADAMPQPSPIAPLSIALGKRARALGSDVLLTGSGGDDVLDGEPRLFAELAARGEVRRSVRSALSLADPYGGALWRAENYLMRPLLRHLVPRALSRARLARSMRARCPWAGPRLRGFLRHADLARAPEVALDASPAERHAAMTASPLIALNAVHRAQEETATGCARRDPFFDDALMRAVARLPPLALLHGGYVRGLLREAMRGLLPEDLRLRRTKGVLEPALAEMVGGAGGFAAFEPLADVRRLADLGLVEPSRFRAEFDALARRPAGRWWSVWSVLATESFLRGLP